MNEVHAYGNNIGALSNAIRPLFKVPAAYGGITVVGAQAAQAAAGTTSLALVELASDGTTVSGTLGTWGTVFALNTPLAATLTASRCFVDAGNYIGVKELNVGAANAVCVVSIEYVMGKAEAA
jgi:hypothetical protein